MRFIYTRAFAIFSILVIVVFAVTFLELRGLGGFIRGVFLNAPRPIVAGTQKIMSPISSFFSTIYGIRGLAQENIVMHEKIHTLEQQLADFDQSQRENEALKRELGFIAVAKQTFIPCSVIAENPLGLTDTLVLNCGSDSGVEDGLGVVSQNYMIGKVNYVAKNSSTVLLITNSKFSADARISKSSDSGVAKGSYGSGIILDQLSQNAQTNKGDLVVTAGINDKVPKNILIGEIGDTLSNQNDLFKRTTLLSPVDFSNIQFVFVVK